MKYLLLIVSDPTLPSPEPGDEGFDEYMAAWTRYTQDMVEAGAYGGGEALQGPETATTVRHEAGATTLVDGPFAELKEHVGGYYVVDVDTLDDALEWARRLPVGTGAVEVRPIFPTDGF
ncbi:YciI family protein [Demequina sp. SYSU T00192]|uniref:YciI family protein n=1 Tax=Demequina litoralis TaxID=3051660 RepID=A0ABT8GA16_9MICO|nr:YciI family protein [Demequina sp. SYSU T00192]MDN4475978.1 YciI family protein [Demequina sp. SYSU T00192]